MVAVEVVGLLVAFSVFGCPVSDLYQKFVAVGIGVDIGIPVTILRKLYLAQIIVPNTLCHNLNRQFPQTHLKNYIFLLYLLELVCLLHRNLH